MQRVPTSLELTLKVKVKILHCKMQFNNYSQTQIDFSAIIRRIFFSKFLENILYANSEYPDQTPHDAASDLGMHYLHTPH